MLQTRSSILLVAQVNTIAGGQIVQISNSAGWVVSVANTGGVVAVSNTSPLVQVQNSAGWVFAQSNTNNQGVIIQNSGGLFANQSGTWVVTIANTGGTLLSQTIANTAGWVVTIANTGGTALSQTLANTAGWIVSVANTAGISIANTANWVVAQSNTGGNVSVANSAGWVVYSIDSTPKVISVTTVVSTIGTVTLMNSNAARVEGFIYNASVNPLFMRLGSSASTTFYTLMMVASGYYELPRPVFQGQITGIWGTANGQAVVTEIS